MILVTVIDERGNCFPPLADRIAACDNDAPSVVVVMRRSSYEWLEGRANKTLYPGRGTDEVGRDIFWCMDCKRFDPDILDFMVHDDIWLLGVPENRGVICIDCFGKRLAARGRKLTWRDLQPLEVNLKHRLRLEK